MSDLGPNDHLIGEPGSRDRLSTPALIVDLDALERNIEAMAAYCRTAGVALRPHCKTHKSARVARMQMDAGAVGICAVTLGEAEMLVDAGIPGVLITSPVIAAKAGRLAALNARADGLMVVVDNTSNVDELAAAAQGSGAPLTVVVDFDVGTHRTGVADADGALALAERIAGSNVLDYGGVQAYAGHLQHVVDYGERRTKAMEQTERIVNLGERLEAAGLAPPVVTGAGTGTHDIDARSGVFTEMQAGSYVFTDVDYARVALRDGAARPFDAALFVQTTVVSANTPGQATTDAGLKRFATDGPDPVPVRGAPDGAIYRFMGDEHGAVVFSEPSQVLAVGDVVECLTPHCDPTVNLWDLYHLVRGDTLVDIWPVDARGAI
jgi:3-hydroxy-D-aspartate aldolase